MRCVLRLGVILLQFYVLVNGILVLILVWFIVSYLRLCVVVVFIYMMNKDVIILIVLIMFVMWVMFNCRWWLQCSNNWYGLILIFVICMIIW